MSAAAGSSRRCFVGGNWKAAIGLEGAKAQIERINAGGAFPGNVDVAVFPSALHLSTIATASRKDVSVGVQDIHTAKGFGAFTGSHTIDQVKEFPVAYVLTGHSERRSIWHESDAETAAKTKLVVEAGLTAVLCIGETLAEREAGHTMDVVIRQMKAVVDVLPKDAWSKVVVAYEPVWAIGTGKVATAEQAQEVHAALRKWIGETIGADVAAAIRIIYGGSVTGASAAGLIAGADIDGFLVGGASLKPEFVDIIKATATKA